MNALATIQPAAVPTFTMSDMERVALAIAKGGLFGSSDPNAVLTLCMLAQAEGQHPAVVFRDYHIISGKPAKKAEAMHRDFLAAGGRIEWHRCDDECADATFSHPAGGSMRITWDNARVQQAQLTGNAMHKKYPRQMKRSRVISEGVRSVFPMATSGLYESGEVQDIVADTGPARPATPQPQRARDMQAPPAADMAFAEEAPRQTAKQFADAHIAAIDACTDADSLATLADEKATDLDRLDTAAPKQRERIRDAERARFAALTAEGPADEQRGETHTGSGAVAATRIAMEIAEAENADIVGAIMTRERSTIDAMDDECRQSVWDARDKRLKAMGGRR
jgi:hypothetical protein